MSSRTYRLDFHGYFVELKKVVDPDVNGLALSKLNLCRFPFPCVKLSRPLTQRENVSILLGSRFDLPINVRKHIAATATKQRLCALK